MSTWEERMAARAKERQIAAEAAKGTRQAEEYARLAAEAGLPLPGEDEDLGNYAGHEGHRTHMHDSHGGSVVCQCGAFLGLTTFVPDWDNWPPPPCPVCAARGIRQDPC
jgi:hypothetical protein